MSIAQLLVRLAAFVVVGVIVLLPGASDPSSAEAVVEGTAPIQNVATGKCIDVEDASQSAFARIIQWPCHGGLNQEWEIDDQDNIDFLRSGHTNGTMCIDVPGGSTSSGTGLIQYPCHFEDNQGFFVIPFGSTNVVINQRSGKCLDVPGSSSGNGVQIIQWTCHGEPNQQWRFLWY